MRKSTHLPTEEGSNMDSCSFEAHTQAPTTSSSTETTSNTSGRKNTRRTRRKSVFGVRKRPRKTPQVVRACNNCRKTRRKCDGVLPCGRCISKEIPQECEFPASVNDYQTESANGNENEESSSSLYSLDIRNSFTMVKHDDPNYNRNEFRVHDRAFRTTVMRRYVNARCADLQSVSSIGDLEFAAMEIVGTPNGISKIVINHPFAESLNLNTDTMCAHINARLPILVETVEQKWDRCLHISQNMHSEDKRAYEAEFYKPIVTDPSKCFQYVKVTCTQIHTVAIKGETRTLRLGFLWPAERIQDTIQGIPHQFAQQLDRYLDLLSQQECCLYCEQKNVLSGSKTFIQRTVSNRRLDGGDEKPKIREGDSGKTRIIDCGNMPQWYSLLLPIVEMVLCTRQQIALPGDLPERLLNTDYSLHCCKGETATTEDGISFVTTSDPADGSKSQNTVMNNHRSYDRGQLLLRSSAEDHISQQRRESSEHLEGMHNDVTGETRIDGFSCYCNDCMLSPSAPIEWDGLDQLDHREWDVDFCLPDDLSDSCSV